MNLKQLIKFGMEESSIPVIKNPILRAALEPRPMIQEPRTLAQGGGMMGQLVQNTADGSRPGYSGRAEKLLTFRKQQKIKDAFPNIKFDFTEDQKFGVKKYLESKKPGPDIRKVNKDYTTVARFIKKGYTKGMGEGLTTRSTKYQKEGKRLSIEDQNKIKAKYDLPEGVKEWDFKTHKYGIKQAGREKLVVRMAKTVADKTPWTLAADFGGAKGWMMLQMNRVYENEKAAGKLRPGAKKFTYEPIFDKFGDREIIIGFKDNTVAGKGKTYYGLNKYTKKGAGDWTKHGDWKLNNKLIDISKRSKNAPNDVIIGLLKDRGFTNLDGKLKLNHLIHFLSGTEGTSKEMLKNAIVRHHNSGVAFGSATDDLALTTQTINKKITGIEKRIRADKILPDDIQTLKNNNVYVRHNNKLYGSGSKTPIGQFKQIESSVAKALESGVDLKGKKFDNKKLLKFFKDAGIPCLKGPGGQCNSIVDYQKGYNKIVKEGAEGSAEAIQKLKGFTKAMRGFKGIAKWTGYGLLAEAGFMVPFAIADYSAGESWKRILGNATDYGFGPILGQSEQEEFEAALPEGSFAVEGEKAWELSEQLRALDEQKFRPQGRGGFNKARREESRANVITGIEDEFKLNLDPFLSDTPWAKDQWHDRMWTQAHQDAADARAQIAKEKKKRIDERIARGIIADRNWQSQVSRAEGGIMNLKKKW